MVPLTELGTLKVEHAWGQDDKFNFGQAESEQCEGPTSGNVQESRWSLELWGKSGLSRLVSTRDTGLP